MAGIAVLDRKATKSSINQVLAAMLQDKRTNVSVQTLFRSQGWFHACVDMRAKSIQNLPWSVTSTGSEDPIWTHEDAEIPDNLMFARDLPNLLYKWEASLVTTNRAYSLKENKGRGLSALPYFSPFTMEPIKTPQGISGFKRTVNSGMITLQAKDVFYMFASDPFVELGYAEGNSAKTNATVLRAMDGFLQNFVEKGAIKATILGVKGAENIPPAERESLLAKWKKSVAGWWNGGETHLFNADIVPHVIGEGFEGVGDKDITENQREAISNAFGIPHSLLSKSVANSKKEEDQITYIVKTVMPQAKFIMRELNHQIFEPLGLQFFFDFKKLEEIQSREIQKAAAIQVLTGGKQVLRVNEAREWLGLEPDDFLDEEAQFERSLTIAQSRRPQPNIEGTDDEPGEEEQKGAYINIPYLLPNKEGGYDYVQKTVESDSLDEGIKSLEIEAELRNWRNKVEKKGRAVKFSPDHLKDYETAIIKQRLATDEPLDEVFKPPFVGF